MIETFFTEKRIIKKIIIALVFIFMFNFTFSYLGNNVVFAETYETTKPVEDEYELTEGGGKLLLPIHSLILFLADSCMNLMQNSFRSQEPVVIKARANSQSSWSGLGAVLIGVGIVVIAGVCTFGIGSLVAAGVEAGVITTTIATGITSAVMSAGRYSYALWWSLYCSCDSYISRQYKRRI